MQLYNGDPFLSDIEIMMICCNQLHHNFIEVNASSIQLKKFNVSEFDLLKYDTRVSDVLDGYFKNINAKLVFYNNESCKGYYITDDATYSYVNFSKDRLKYFKKIKEGQNWKSLPKSIQKEAMGSSYFAGGGKTGFYRRLGWNKPSPTLVTDPTMPATDLGHPDKNRPISIQEYKRIQEFPDEWRLSGSLRNQYKQIGNAVPISLGKAIGKLIVNHMMRKKIKVISNFRYSRYLNTSDLDWQKNFNNKTLSRQKSFKF